jgi:hypothetical protein
LTRVFEGGIGKNGWLWWFFDGENVVECVVNVVGNCACVGAEGWDRLFGFIFGAWVNGKGEIRGSFAAL